MRLIVLALSALQCAPLPAPAAEPSPGPYPSAGCDESCATTQRLACKWYSPSCESDCVRANAMLAKIHSAPLNTACIAAAATCESSWACRGEDP